MSIVIAPDPDVRAAMRRPDDALPRASIGIAPILWNNADIVELRHGTDALTILDEIARTGFEGTQLGLGFPEGDRLHDELMRRRLRLAEVYVSLPVTADGPTAAAMDTARERLRLLHESRGEVLCVALDLSPGREERAGRATEAGTPGLSDVGWDALATGLHDIARVATSLGHPVVFHPHAGTFVETVAEIERLVAATDPDHIGVCLDVGHLIVGGGDPVTTLAALGERVTHVHLKDVDGTALGRLRDGTIAGFNAGVRARLFTELGAGLLDLDGIVQALSERDYEGWLMIEQDSCWGPPSESAAIGRRVLASALRRAGRAEADR